MPIYQYACEFGHLYEEYQSITSFDKNRIVECAECGNNMETIIGEPSLVSVRGEINTLGQLGEANWKALGKTRQQEKAAKNKESKEQAQRELLKEKGLDGVSIPDYNKAKKLNSLTAEQKKKYIHTGKLP